MYLTMLEEMLETLGITQMVKEFNINIDKNENEFQTIISESSASSELSISIKHTTTVLTRTHYLLNYQLHISVCIKIAWISKSQLLSTSMICFDKKNFRIRNL